MPTWPGALPQRLHVAGYRELPPNNVVRTEMDVGPPKIRRRATVGHRIVQGRILCTAAQIATLDAFFVTTCLDGSVTFDWINSRTGAAATYQFRDQPVGPYEPEDKDHWWVPLNLLQMG